jgi:hypothetical protein
MEEKEKTFLRQFDNGKKLFSHVFRKSKKDIVLEDEDDFIDALVEDLKENFKMAEDDAKKYAQMVYEIWEDCACSLTSFDRMMNAYKKEIFSNI